MARLNLEQRMTAVEEELGRMRKAQSRSPRTHPIHTLEALHATFDDDDAFREAVAIGRKWRASQRPKRGTKAMAKSK